MELSELREKIDVIDRQIIELMERRMDISAQVAEYKRLRGLPVLDAAREQAKLEQMAGLCRPETAEYIQRLYREIFSISRDCQQRLLEEEHG